MYLASAGREARSTPPVQQGGQVYAAHVVRKAWSTLPAWVRRPGLPHPSGKRGQVYPTDDGREATSTLPAQVGRRCLAYQLWQGGQVYPTCMVREARSSHWCSREARSTPRDW